MSARGPVRPFVDLCGVVFHTRSYCDLTHPKFQKLVAFNAASTTPSLQDLQGSLV
jgi:hypothetical protein